MDWFKGEITGTSFFFMVKSMVSGQDFPLSQSTEYMHNNYGGFLKWGYLLNYRIFLHKPTIWGYLHFRTPHMIF